MNNQVWCLYTKTIGKKLALFTIIDGIGCCDDEPLGLHVDDLEPLNAEECEKLQALLSANKTNGRDHE